MAEKNPLVTLCHCPGNRQSIGERIKQELSALHCPVYSKCGKCVKTTREGLLAQMRMENPDDPLLNLTPEEAQGKLIETLLTSEPHPEVWDNGN